MHNLYTDLSNAPPEDTSISYKTVMYYAFMRTRNLVPPAGKPVTNMWSLSSWMWHSCAYTTCTIIHSSLVGKVWLEWVQNRMRRKRRQYRQFFHGKEFGISGTRKWNSQKGRQIQGRVSLLMMLGITDCFCADENIPVERGKWCYSTRRENCWNDVIE